MKIVVVPDEKVTYEEPGGGCLIATAMHLVLNLHLNFVSVTNLN